MCIPPTLYKYREPNTNTTRLLKDGELYFSSTDGFEDKNEKSCFKFTQAVYITDKNNTVRKITPEENKQRYLKSLKSGKTELYGVLSLCESPTEDPMWQQYGGDGHGLCIGFEWDKIEQNHFGSWPPVKNKPSKVRYVDEPLVITARYVTMTQWIEIYNTKYLEYAFEKEWRMFYKTGKFIHESVRHAISEIVFGYNMSNAMILEIINLVKDLPEIKFFKAQKLGDVIQLKALELQMPTLDFA